LSVVVVGVFVSVVKTPSLQGVVIIMAWSILYIKFTLFKHWDGIWYGGGGCGIVNSIYAGGVFTRERKSKQETIVILFFFRVSFFQSLRATLSCD